VEDDDGDPAANGSLMKGRVKAGDQGPLCHRLERLVHLELADLAVNAPYLDPDFPTSKKNAEGGSGTSTPSKKPPGSPAAKRTLSKPCPDCRSLDLLSTHRVLTASRWCHPQRNILVDPCRARTI
jgi:hypothetical protein